MKFKSFFFLNFVFLLCYGSSYSQNHPPVVTHVLAQQRENNYLVDIQYDVADQDGDNLLIRVKITDNGDLVTAPSISGDIGFDIVSGVDKKITWNAGIDYHNRFGDYFVAKIEAYDESSDHSAYSDPFTVDTRIDKPPVQGWQVITDSGSTYNENLIIDHEGRIWCFYLRSTGSHQPVYMKVMNSSGNIIKSEQVIGHGSSLSVNNAQTVRAALNPTTEDMWVVIQGNHEQKQIGYFLIFDKNIEVKRDSTVIPTPSAVNAPKIAADHNGQMWFCWHTDTSGGNDTKGEYIRSLSNGLFDPDTPSIFTETGNIINTDIAVDARNQLWFIYEKAEESAYLVYNQDHVLVANEIYSTEAVEFDPRRSLYSDERHSKIWILQKNRITSYYRLNGYSIDPPANFAGINQVDQCQFILSEDKRLEIVRYNSDSNTYEHSEYHPLTGFVFSDWNRLFEGFTAAGYLSDYIAYNPIYPNLKAYLAKTDEQTTKVKLFHVQPESIAVSLSADSLDFGLVGIDTVKSLTVAVRNSGNMELIVTELTVSDDHFSALPTSFQVAPEDSQILEISFSPTHLDEIHATLALQSNATDGDDIIHFRGKGYQRTRQITLEPEALDFDPLGVGYTVTDFFSIKNTGTEAIFVSAITSSDESFIIRESSFEILPGNSRAVEVLFTPRLTGNISALARIYSNASTNPDSMVLNGIGLETVWAIEAKPDTLDFGSVPIAYPEHESFVIYNIGTEPIRVDSIKLSDEHFRIEKTGAHQILAGDSIEIAVEFSPTGTEAITAVAWIYTNIPEMTSHTLQVESEYQVTLKGKGFYLNAPKIMIEPTSLEFMDVPIKIPVEKTVRVMNGGIDTLIVNKVTITNSQFTIREKDFNFSVLPGDTHRVGIIFTPQVVNTTEAWIRFHSNDPMDSVSTVTVIGRAHGAPVLYVNPSSGLIFTKHVAIGDSSSRTFYISNLGTDTLFISSIQSNNTQFIASYDTSSYGRRLYIAPAPNDRALFVTVTFKPENAGPVDAALTIENNDPVKSIFKFPLFGTGRQPIPPQITVDPDSIDFGIVDLNASRSRELLIKNQGESRLTISSISSSNAHFSVKGDLPVSLGTLDSIFFVVQFSPDSSLGYEGYISIASNDPEQPVKRISVSGDGRPLRNQKISVEPSRLDFGEIAVGSTSTRSIWIYNSGEKPLTVSNILPNHEDYTVSLTNFVVSPGSYQYVGIHYKPVNAGLSSGNIDIFSNDPDYEIFTVTVNGIGRSLTPSYISTDLVQNTLNFGSVAFQQTSSIYLKVSNNGEQALTISNIVLSNAQFSVNRNNATIYPKSYQWFYVGFRPNQIGEVRGEMTITSDAGNNRNLLIQLIGTGRKLNPPAIVLSHNSYDFGQVGISMQKSFYLSVTNQGEEVLNVTLTNPDTAAFSFSNDHFDVLAGQTQYVIIFFRPNLVQTYANTIIVSSNDPSRRQLAITLTGTGRAIKDQKIQVEPAFLTFDSVAVSRTESKSLWIRNDGEKDLIIRNIEARTTTYLIDNPGFTLTPNSSRTIFVSFRPSEFLTYQDTLTIDSNDPSASQYKVPLYGIGRPLKEAKIALYPTVIDYGTVALNSSSFYNVQVMNAGEKTLQIKSVTRTNTKNFWIPAEQYSFQVASGSSGFIQVEFKPVENTAFQDSLIISNNDPLNPAAIVILRGSGRDSTDQNIFISSDNIDFSEVGIGREWRKEFTISNLGERVLNINRMTSDRAAFGIDSTGFSLAAHETRSVWVTFSPTKLETYTGFLTIESNDSIRPAVQIGLSGKGRDLRAQQALASTDSLYFGELTIGASSQRSFYLHNVGDLPLIIYSIAASDEQFQVDRDSTTIPGGSSQWITVTFQPNRMGQSLAFLTIQTNDPSQGAIGISLLGAAFEQQDSPKIAVSPTMLNFGTVAIGQTHARIAWLSNLGTGTLTIFDIQSSDSSFFVYSSDINFTLNPGDYRSITLYFRPNVVDSVAAYLTIRSNDPNHPNHQVPVMAAVRNLFNQQISVAQDTLNFGIQPKLSTSSSLLWIRNVGEKTLEINDVSLTNRQFSVFNRNFSILPGSSYYLPVNFTPEAVGTIHAMLTIKSDDPANENVNIVMTGTGREALAQKIALSAQSLDFGTTIVNRSRSRSFYILNQGEKNLEITSITILNSQFTISEPVFVIAPGDSKYVNVIYHPTLTDTIAIDIIIKNNDNDPNKRTLMLPIKATCIRYDGPQIFLRTTSLNFNKLLSGSYKTLSFYVSNLALRTTLVVENMLISENFRNYFKVTPEAFIVSGGDSQLVQVTFHPTYQGYFNTEITIDHNDLYSEYRHIMISGQGIQDIQGEDVLSSLTGWNSNGYFPFTDLLGNGPDNAWFLKDVYLLSQPNSAMLYVAFKDSIQIFVNGSLVTSAASDTLKRVYEWNISGLDIKPYLNRGRNRIASYVYNRTGQGGFDCVLLIDNNPVIRHGGYYPHESTLWWYYGQSGSVSQPPVAFDLRTWYSLEYGWTNLDSVVANWNFEPGLGDTIYEHSSYGRQVILKNVSYVDGIIGKAVQFNGDNNSHIALQANIDGVPQSIELWLYAYGTVSHKQTIIHNGHVGYNGHGMFLDANSILSIYYPNGVFSTNFRLAPKKWYFVVLQYTLSELQVYVNNIKVASFSYQRALPGGFNGTYIGANPALTGEVNGFYGIIDELKILNTSAYAPIMNNVASIAYHDTSATVQQDLNLIFQVAPSPFRLIQGFLEYARGGHTTFKKINIAVTDSNSVGSALTVRIPRSDLTVYGVKGKLTLKTDYGTIQYPAENELFWVPVYSNGENAAVPVDSIYRMISVPYELDDASVTSIFQDDLGLYSPYDWRLFQWNPDPGVNDYVEYSDSNWFSQPGLRRGHAVWLLGSEKKEFNSGGGWSARDMESFHIELKPGWNQIGNPFPFPVAWESIQNKSDISDLVYYHTEDSIGYERNWQVMDPWEGYFVRNEDNVSNRTIFIPPVATSTIGLRKSKPLARELSMNAEILIDAEAHCGRYFDRDNLMGASSLAQSEWDPGDFTEPPPIGDHIALWIDNEHWKSKAGHYSVDMKPTGAEGYYWYLAASVNISRTNDDYHLKIREVLALPEDWMMMLFDLDQDIAINLTAMDHYQFPFEKKNLTIKRFKLVIGTEKFVNQHNDGIPLQPLSFELFQNYPNPFNPSTTIAFNLPKQSSVKIYIYNMLGQRVRLLTDEAMRGGHHQILWDGRDEAGIYVSSGIYFVQLKAESMTEMKKMMIIK